MKLEEKIDDCIFDLEAAWYKQDEETIGYLSERLAYLIKQRTPKQIKKMEIEKGLV
jgi:hypothetical protein